MPHGGGDVVWRPDSGLWSHGVCVCVCEARARGAAQSVRECASEPARGRASAAGAEVLPPPPTTHQVELLPRAAPAPTKIGTCLEASKLESDFYILLELALELALEMVPNCMPAFHVPTLSSFHEPAAHVDAAPTRTLMELIVRTVPMYVKKKAAKKFNIPLIDLGLPGWEGFKKKNKKLRTGAEQSAEPNRRHEGGGADVTDATGLPPRQGARKGPEFRAESDP